MLYVTHRMDEIFVLADRVTVFRDGAVVATGPIAEFSRDRVVRAVTGRAVDQVFPLKVPGRGKPILAVRNLVVEAYGPVDFDLGGGEVLALVGLRGAGHEAVGRAIFGAMERRSGTVRTAARDVGDDSGDAIAAGLGFVSGRRAEEAIAGSLTVRENLFLNPDFLRVPALRFRRSERPAAAAASRRFAISPDDPERLAVTLSGGNQQKVVVARWVAADSQVFILEEPTAGVDVGAKAEIYAVIAGLMREGRGAILVSSDFEEVAGLAHRALVFDRGKVVKELAGDALTVATISLHASASEAANAGVSA